jgi:hypothetical protein
LDRAVPRRRRHQAWRFRRRCAIREARVEASLQATRWDHWP